MYAEKIEKLENEILELKKYIKKDNDVIVGRFTLAVNEG